MKNFFPGFGNFHRWEIPPEKKPPLTTLSRRNIVGRRFRKGGGGSQRIQIALVVGSGKGGGVAADSDRNVDPHNKSILNHVPCREQACPPALSQFRNALAHRSLWIACVPLRSSSHSHSHLRVSLLFSTLHRFLTLCTFHRARRMFFSFLANISMVTFHFMTTLPFTPSDGSVATTTTGLAPAAPIPTVLSTNTFHYCIGTNFKINGFL